MERRADEKKTASSRVISAALKKDKNIALKPSDRTVRRLKSEMRFHVTKVEQKPQLNSGMMQTHFKFVKWALTSVNFDDVIVCDEKWFTEHKEGDLKIELPRGHIPPGGRKTFAPKRTDGDTSQLNKLMYLSAVSASAPIGNWELDFSKHTRTIKSGKRRGEVVKAGVVMKAPKKLSSIESFRFSHFQIRVF